MKYFLEIIWNILCVKVVHLWNYKMEIIFNLSKFQGYIIAQYNIKVFCATWLFCRFSFVINLATTAEMKIKVTLTWLLLEIWSNLISRHNIKIAYFYVKFCMLFDMIFYH